MSATLLTVLALAIVHLAAGTTAALGYRWRPRALSAASGVSVAYVFLDLMPDLAEQQSLIDREGSFPGLDQHVYILALVGLTVSFWVETAIGYAVARSAAAFPVAGRLTPSV